jgi:hypothetical protein
VSADGTPADDAKAPAANHEGAAAAGYRLSMKQKGKKKDWEQRHSSAEK